MMDDMTKLRVLQIYYNHWGWPQQQALLSRKAISTTMMVISSLWIKKMEYPVDTDEAQLKFVAWTMKKYMSALLLYEDKMTLLKRIASALYPDKCPPIYCRQDIPSIFDRYERGRQRFCDMNRIPLLYASLMRHDQLHYADAILALPSINLKNEKANKKLLGVSKWTNRHFYTRSNRN